MKIKEISSRRGAFPGSLSWDRNRRKAKRSKHQRLEVFLFQLFSMRIRLNRLKVLDSGRFEGERSRWNISIYLWAVGIYGGRQGNARVDTAKATLPHALVAVVYVVDDGVLDKYEKDESCKTGKKSCHFIMSYFVAISLPDLLYSIWKKIQKFLFEIFRVLWPIFIIETWEYRIW